MTEVQEEKYNRVGDFNMLSQSQIRLAEKNHDRRFEPNKKFDLMDGYRTLFQTAAENIFFSGTHVIFMRIIISGPWVNLNKFYWTEIILSMSSKKKRKENSNKLEIKSKN